LVFGLCTLAWLVPTLLAAGGPGVYVDLIVDYLNQQAGGESVLLGASWRPWLHQMSRLVTWNGLAVAGWLLAVPIFLHSEGRIRLRSLEAGFIAAWVAPGILIQALTHVAAPGHTLFSVAAFCLLGSHVLHCSIAHVAGARRYYPVCQLALAVVLAFNAMIFLNVFPTPAPAAASSGPLRGLSSVRDALYYGAFETSRDQIMWVDDITHTSLKEIDAFTPRGRPSIIVSVEGGDQEFNFLNWRIASYYLPAREIWVLIDHPEPMSQERWTRVVRGPRVVEKHGNDGLRIPVPAGGRIIWLMERDTPFMRQLSKVLPLKQGRYVSYTDVRSDMQHFNFRNFEFVVK